MNDDAKRDWERAIERNCAALRRIAAMLFAMLGLGGGVPETVPRRARRRLLRFLRPAESAARRLILAAARGIAVPPPRVAPPPAPSPVELLRARGLLVSHGPVFLGLARRWVPETPAPEEPEPGSGRVPAFRLADPHRRFDFWARPGRARLAFAELPPDEALAREIEEVPARALCNRVMALKAALEDLPAQAKRLARLRARREAARAVGRERCKVPSLYRFPLRYGPPPGWRRRPRDGTGEVDRVLAECHRLALAAMRPDTS
ncbi:hypothetical protein [Oricola thermophila]|uniref:Uncharacterized protein n=1 Tax=Oricola thermophila TaxID=2742145 RepID=A0A6N1V855_9HYPH|nr:hypothetical protein [Oricola thermophila]QKV17074.1 hypothetical protein HTY61_00625 [Oricola thermophila]